MIVAHNHPAGDPAPSQEDSDITKRLVDAGKLLDRRRAVRLSVLRLPPNSQASRDEQKADPAGDEVFRTESFSPKRQKTQEKQQ